MVKNKIKNKNIKKWLCLCLSSLVLVAFCSISFFNYKDVNASVPIDNTNGQIIMSNFANGVIITTHDATFIDYNSNNEPYYYTYKGSVSTSTSDVLLNSSNSSVFNGVGVYYQQIVTDPIYFENDNFNFLIRSTSFKSQSNYLVNELDVYQTTYTKITLSNVFLPVTDLEFYDENILNVLGRTIFNCSTNDILNFKYNINYYDVNYNNYSLSGQYTNSLNNINFGSIIRATNNAPFIDLPIIISGRVDATEIDFYCLSNVEIIITSNVPIDLTIYNRVYRNSYGNVYTYNDYMYLLNCLNSFLYERGYNLGFADGSAELNLSPFTVILNTVEGFLNFEPFPNFPIYYLFIIGFGGTLIMFFVKWALGG